MGDIFLPLRLEANLFMTTPSFFRLWITFLFLIGGCGKNSPREYPIKPVSFTQVQIDDSFWTPRLKTNREVTIPYCFKKIEEDGTIQNFEIAGGLKQGEQAGSYPFNDTDAYKTIEAASYSLHLQPDPQLDQFVDSLIFKIAAAQEEDGYLYTSRTNKAKRLASWAGDTRWSRLERSHELYNAGHLYEAAVAHYESTGKRTLLEVAIKNADLITNTFGANKLRLPPGHQEIETGLVKLYRVARNSKYLQLAKFFLDQRGQLHGRDKDWGAYAQDHKPILQQDEAVGHAVRQAYMNMGMMDVAAYAGASEYSAASERLWENVVAKKLYITGGIGAMGMGERFSDNYDLPNMTAYSETCSSIGNVLWNHRLFLYHGDAKYIDVLERTLYNALLSGLAMSGDRFFYDNPLASNGQHQRSGWFVCACCPPNLARFLPQLQSMIYSTRNNDIFVNLYVNSRATISLNNTSLELRQETGYPWDGKIRLSVESGNTEGTFHLRIPGWAQNRPVPSDLYRFFDQSTEPNTLVVNGEPLDLKIEKGFAQLHREWKAGDVIELNLSMPILRIVANENVKADAGKVALQRGPIVFCAEAPDNKDGQVMNLALANDAGLHFVFRKDLLNGVGTISGKASAVRLGPDGKTLLQETQDFTAIPYYAWSYRGRGEMAVWLAADAAHAQPLNAPSLAALSRVTSSGGTGIDALNKEREPASSRDISGGAFVWSVRSSLSRSTSQDTTWVQYDFPHTAEVSQVEVYWLNNANVRLPQSWRIFARVNGEWASVWSQLNMWGTESDRFNKVIFETVRTDAVRLQAILPSGASSGILVWNVY